MKKILALVLLTIALTVFLSSCKVKKDDVSLSDSGDYIYAPKSSLTLVYDSGEISRENAMKLSNVLFEKVGVKFVVANSTAPMAEHEIVVERAREIYQTQHTNCSTK